MHPLVIFDDDLGQLGPMTDVRASFEVRTGMFTTAGRIAAGRPRTLAGYWVPEHLKELLARRADALVNQLPDAESVQCVNGRWAMPDLGMKLEVGQALRERDSGHVVTAVLRRADAEYFLRTGQLHERAMVEELPQRVLYRYPWDVIALMQQTIPHDILSTRVLEAKVMIGRDVIGPHPVEVNQSARIYPQVIFDAEEGPVIVHESAVVRTGAILRGPCSVGKGATVMERTVIKPYTVIGHGCKVGGEIGATIFQGYANKAHDGHLGDSWVGKWANVGAGTCNSNLLNTYAEVKMRVEPEGPIHRTGLTFLGVVVGDHVKLAINSRIMTGTVIGTGAMIALSRPVPTAVRRFAWLTDAGERIFARRKFMDTVQTVMARRHRTPSPPYLKLLEQLYDRASAAAGERV
jgi:UDP-N-acetylglucosamine diphosphorylase/glucosamine-1-phosphate N-acetyltransferase